MKIREDEIIGWLSQWVDKKRLEHSLGVSRTAALLALHYGVDVDKARIAGLVHDCAKCLSYEEMATRLKEYGMMLDPISMGDRALIHGHLGAEMVRRMLGIEDPEILNAIACHTTGKKRMALLDKILCLADYIEPGRQYAGIGTIRQLAYKDIDRALLKGMEFTIRHVLDSGSPLHPGTVEARNELLAAIGKNQVQNNQVQK